MGSKRFLRKKIVPTILVAGVALAGLRFTSPHPAGEQLPDRGSGQGDVGQTVRRAARRRCGMSPCGGCTILARCSFFGETS